MMCCIDKCLVVWNLDRVVNVCRERCGGQGFLACNRFGEYLAITHAAMTAEGDNRVLMIKIVKDMMTNIQSKKSQLPKLKYCPKNQLPQLMDVLQLDYLLDLLKYREVTLFNQLTTFLHKRTKEDKANPFEVLMFESSDAVQNLAQAYGERQALEFCIDQLKSIKCGGVKATFELIFKIFAVDIILRDLGFYLS